MLSVLVYLSTVGIGLVALPAAAIQAIARPAASPVQTAAAVLGAVDGGVGTQGYYLSAKLAAPSVVNLGNLNLSWIDQGAGKGQYLGVKLGTLNTTAPINCPGSGVLLQLDAQVGDYSARLSRLGGDSSTVAARVEYTCS